MLHNRLQLHTPIIRRTNGQNLETLGQSNDVSHIGGHRTEMYFHVELSTLCVAYALSDLLFYVS